MMVRVVFQGPHPRRQDLSDELKPTPSLGISLIPVVILIASLFYTIVVLEGSGHIPLIFGAAVAALRGR